MKSVRGVFIAASVVAVLSFGVVAFFMFYGPDRIDIAGRSFTELLKDEKFLPIIIVPVVLFITGFSMIPILRTIFPQKIKNGLKAQAKVLKVWDTGVSINDNPQVGMLMEVRDIAGSTFQVEGKTIVSRLNAALVQPGITAEVMYDPEKPKRVQILQLNVSSLAAAPGGSAAPGDTAARLEELNGLRDKGLITQEEYNQKRADILKAL
jgi:hypothetical protein